MHEINWPMTVLGIGLSCGAYLLALTVARWCRVNPWLSMLANPVVVAVAVVVLTLSLTAVPYQAYFKGAQAIHFLLGPATVALAIPLAQQAQQLRRLLKPLLLSLLIASVTSIVSAFVITVMCGGPQKLAISMAPKSATTPIAMAITEGLGGYPAVSAAVVITTGIVGALMAGLVFRLLGAKHIAAQGFALGIAAHGVGTARAFQLSPVLGAYAGLGMGLNGIMTAILTPLLVPPMLTLLY